MPRLTVTNKQSNPVRVHPASGSTTLDPGKSFTGDFSDAEATNMTLNTNVFDVTEHGADGKVIGKGAPGGDPADDKDREHAKATMAALSPIASRLYAATPEQFAEFTTAKLDELDAANQVIADIAALFPGETIKPADLAARLAKELIAKSAQADGVVTGSGGGSGAAPMTLAKAVASLDDKNEAHWTDAGKPDLDTLKTLTGHAVLRADVDALVPPRVRKTA